MANEFTLAQKYTALLDEKFRREALTSLLETPDRVGDFVGANTVKYFKVTTSGLGDYDRSADAFPKGKVKGEWEVFTLDKDRGMEFTIDAMDNDETLGLAVGAASSQFMKVEVVPEVDAYRFSKMAQTEGIQTTAGAALTGSNVVSAIDSATTALDDEEVPAEGRILYVTPTIYQAVKQSKAATRIIPAGEGIDRRFDYFDGMPIVKVPQGRFYTEIDLNDGVAGGAGAAGGYAKASEGKNINFLMVHPSSLIVVAKHATLRMFPPEVNQKSDGWLVQYRIYHDLFVYENKTKGIYLHKSTS